MREKPYVPLLEITHVLQIPIGRPVSESLEAGFELEGIDRYQRQAEISHFDNQAMQCRLIGDESAEHCLPAIKMGDPHPAEPF